MGVYVDAGVIRIQEYLLRTSGADDRQLRKRRGASLMVADATSPGAFADLGLVPNPESYHVEGVAHLRAVGPDGPNPAGRARVLADEAAQRLRSALPHAYLRVSWAVADSYPAAHPLLAAARDGGQRGGSSGSIDVLPALREDPFQDRCRSCGLSAAEESRQCEDCDRRDGRVAAVAGNASHHTPRSRALEEVSARAGQALRPPKDLSTLADLPRDRRAKRNHLATVYADGNGVGRLFERITDRDEAKELSTAIDEAIRHAGAQALHALLAWCDPGVLPAEVTVLAADDALITVPAPLGWVFVRELVSTFDQAMAETPVVARLVADAEAQGRPQARPSLTAGVVFSHVKSPIERAIQAADTAMRRAKRAPPGPGGDRLDDLTPRRPPPRPHAAWTGSANGRPS